MLTDSVASIVIVNLLTIGVFATKVLMYVFLMFWVRATIPRMRVDRLMGFAWKFLVPVAILNLLVAAIWYEMVIRPATHATFGLGPLTVDMNWLAGVFVTGMLLVVGVGVMHRLSRMETAPDLRPTLTPMSGSAFGSSKTALR
jgi:NADH-quinone oxidoreductase subunit H